VEGGAHSRLNQATRQLDFTPACLGLDAGHGWTGAAAGAVMASRGAYINGARVHREHLQLLQMARRQHVLARCC
jgi:hypothetical protein